MKRCIVSPQYDYKGSPFKKSSLYFKTLPGDEVEYDPQSMTIKTILNRPKNTTIAKVCSEILTLPIMSYTFKSKTDAEDGIYLIDLPGMSLTPISNLYECISRVYLRTGPASSYPMEHTPQTHFTKPFQDLKHLDTFNVDPEDSSDFDDAVSVKYEGPGGSVSRIFVHIVDINHYVIPRSLEDVRAYGLGMTLYNPEGVIHATSGVDQYSLKRGESRRVITTEFRVDNNRITSYDIYQSEIVVKNRYSYKTFSAPLGLTNFIENSMRKDTLAIPFVNLKVRDGVVVSYDLEWSTDFNHKIIETLMIMTNVAVANHLKSRGVGFPSRYHPKKRFSTGSCEHENPIVKSYIELKNFSRAYYSVDFSGHCGLDLEQYTHFTSPLRRYPDVMVHRILAGYIYPEMDVMSRYLSDREKIINDLCYFYSTEMKRSIRDPSRGRYIVKISSSGVFLLDPEIMLEEFVHVSDLEPKCIYRFEGNRLVGESVSYGLGDIVGE